MGVLCMMVSIIATCIGIACLYRQHIKDKKFLAPAQEPIPQELLIDNYEKLELVRELGMSDAESRRCMTNDFRGVLDRIDSANALLNTKALKVESLQVGGLLPEGRSFDEWRIASGYEAYMNLRRQGDHSSADILASTMIEVSSHDDGKLLGWFHGASSLSLEATQKILGRGV